MIDALPPSDASWSTHPRGRGRIILWAALLATLASCHEDPPVELQFAPPLVDGIHVLAAGGASTTGGGIACQGGAGGTIRAFTSTDLQLGAADVTPEPATAPIF